LHTSLIVQGSPSLHGVPFGAGTVEHAPVAGSHAAASHWAPGATVHEGTLPGVRPQMPSSQLSVPLQAFPSSKGAQSASAVQPAQMFWPPRH
jgi:hypothetical protein